MKVFATHVTRYWYSDAVSTCHTEVHLAPRPRPNQILLEHQSYGESAAGFGGDRGRIISATRSRRSPFTSLTGS